MWRVYIRLRVRGRWKLDCVHRQWNSAQNEQHRSWHHSAIECCFSHKYKKLPKYDTRQRQNCHEIFPLDFDCHLERPIFHKLHEHPFKPNKDKIRLIETNRNKSMGRRQCQHKNRSDISHQRKQHVTIRIILGRFQGQQLHGNGRLPERQIQLSQ